MTEPKDWDGGARATGTGLGEADAATSRSTHEGGAGQGGSSGALAGTIDNAVPSTAGDSAMGSDLDVGGPRTRARTRTGRKGRGTPTSRAGARAAGRLGVAFRPA
jgi:hypothetical protein